MEGSFLLSLRDTEEIEKGRRRLLAAKAMSDMDRIAPEESGVEREEGGVSKTANEIYEWVEWGVGIVIAVVLLLSFVVRTVGVFGPSMQDTLYTGDNLIVTRWGKAPAYGDIVAIVQPNEEHRPLIKRVIATEGQTVDIDFETGDVFVDGEKLDEPYISSPTVRQYDIPFPQTVPDGCLFVLGDNRNESLDSRAKSIDMIDTRYILGKAIFRFSPFDRIGFLT